MAFNKETRQEVAATEERVAKFVDPKQLACLAQNIYYEAGSESTEGKAAVARVVMNRIQYGFGNNPCKVIYQSHIVRNDYDEPVKLCQFSWVCENKTKPNENSQRYRNSVQVAYDVLAYDEYKDVLPKSALFFHNKSVNPDWPYQKVDTIGNHVFYSKYKVKKHKRQ
jgi:spore germination cell wall hydrolase CwlJ-like protein